MWSSGLLSGAHSHRGAGNPRAKGRGVAAGAGRPWENGHRPPLAGQVEDRVGFAASLSAEQLRLLPLQDEEVFPLRGLWPHMF